MSGSGDNQSAEEIAAKEAQERELKVAEDVKDGDDAARKAAKKRRKAKKKKAKKMAKKILKKMIKKEQAKYTHSGFHEVPHDYTQFPGNHPNEKFYFVHLGKPLHFDGKDYTKWAYDMQMHLYGFTLPFGRL
jgi:uncharacterized protein YegJ (DUF2314 family)